MLISFLFLFKHHLKNREIQREKKIAFVVEKNNLATQQSETINRHVACKLKVVSGDTMRDEDFKDLAVLLSQLVNICVLSLYSKFILFHTIVPDTCI